MALLAATYRSGINVRVVQPSHVFEGRITSSQPDGKDYKVCVVDNAIEVREISDKVRQEASKQFEAGPVGKVIGGVGLVFIFLAFPVAPVSSLFFGYRIANSHAIHAVVAVAAFFFGVACVAGGWGTDSNKVPDKEFFEQDRIAPVQEARRSFGKNPYESLTGQNPYESLSKKSMNFGCFHPKELLRLMSLAINPRTRAVGDQQMAESLIAIDRLFKSEQLFQHLNTDGLIGASFNDIFRRWKLLDLATPIQRAEEAKKQARREKGVADEVIAMQGNAMKGLGKAIEKTDATGAAILTGVGAGWNKLLDVTIGEQLRQELAVIDARIDKQLREEIARKWQSAMDIVLRIDQLSR